MPIFNWWSPPKPGRKSVKSSLNCQRVSGPIWSLQEPVRRSGRRMLTEQFASRSGLKSPASNEPWVNAGLTSYLEKARWKRNSFSPFSPSTEVTPNTSAFLGTAKSKPSAVIPRAFRFGRYSFSQATRSQIEWSSVSWWLIRPSHM